MNIVAIENKQLSGNDSSVWVVIPSAMAKELDLKKNDEIKVTQTETGILIEKRK